MKYEFFIGFVESITKLASTLSLVRFTPKIISNWAKNRVFLLRLICFWIERLIDAATYFQLVTSNTKPQWMRWWPSQSTIQIGEIVANPPKGSYHFS